MEEVYTVEKTQELRLWYLLAVVNPQEKHREGFAKKEIMKPIVVRPSVHPRYFDTGGLDQFLEFVDPNGRFKVRDVAKIPFRVTYITKEPRVVIEEAVDKLPVVLDRWARHQIKPFSDLVCEDRKKFGKYFLGGDGKIIDVFYGPVRRESNGEDLLSLTQPEDSNIAIGFSYDDFVHRLDKSRTIREEQVRSYFLPKE